MESHRLRKIPWPDWLPICARTKKASAARLWGVRKGPVERATDRRRSGNVIGRHGAWHHFAPSYRQPTTLARRTPPRENSYVDHDDRPAANLLRAVHARASCASGPSAGAVYREGMAGRPDEAALRRHVRRLP